ncbi:DiGeorge syndrome critical region protein 14 [Phlyctochytrium bullatum]|nr:DiGeorge syndrome critical region protein 14 [Phlyctochytrium bullatum]
MGVVGSYTLESTYCGADIGDKKQQVVKSEKGGAVSLATEKNPHKVYLKRAPSPEVLDEDTYIDAVSDIIQRDFFPGLKRLKVQNEFLDAIQSADLPRAKALGLELHRMATGVPGTPRGGGSATPRMETPIVTGFTPYADSNPTATPGALRNPEPVSLSTDDPAAEESEKKYNTSMTLDAFQTMYTSEDNASFSAIMERQNQERRQKYHWYYEKETGRLKLEGGDVKALEGPKPVGLLESGTGSLETKKIDTWKFKVSYKGVYNTNGLR